MFIPITLKGLEVLTALTHPNHLLFVGSWGFLGLSPTPTFNGNWYRIMNTS
ncbi:MAG: hypothetical protein QS721_06855 [Candidatus Endonucleobacter sp. (ex Gigantidas childressi)]|nr:hypothetical protein [Candidatus Endonucleobacter sp. (ex Gigantidas childressi)]